jgi:predicted dehydrogenase
MTPVRIAVAGAGLIGSEHAARISAGPGCVLSGIADPDPVTADLAEGYGTRHASSLEELLAEDPPDGVVVATPNRLHVAQAMACVQARVPVLVEKPIADDVDEAERLVEAAERAGVPLLVGHHRRHSPVLRAAKEVLDSGALGRLVAVQGSAVFYKPDDYFDQGPWRRRPGGGPILVNMVHEVDDLRFLCGEVEVVQALASRRTRGFPVEDTAAVGLGFAGGALGSFLLSDAAAGQRSWEQTSGENPSYARYADEDCYVLVGTKGSLSVPTMRLRVHEGPSSWWEPTRASVVPLEPGDPLVRQLQHFLAVVRGEAAPAVSGRDATSTLRVTLAVAEAARTGGTVRPGG